MLTNQAIDPSKTGQNMRRRVIGVAVLVSALGAARPARALDGPAPGAATADSIKVPDGPASIRGLADPATAEMFTGQIGYQIPIELPAGPAGFKPRLALHYDGGLGNGPLGIGWTLDTAMIRVSDRRGIPAYDGTDELDLSGIAGGGRLVRDPARTNPQQYWVEGKGTSIKVVQRNGHFEVTDPDGVRYFLGMSSASREEQGGLVAAWMVDWIVDLAANEIDYTYLKASNRLYLSNIAWGPLQSSVPVFAAQIDYEARPDAVVSYRTGFPITTGSRATAVRVRSFNHTLRTYRLSYDQTFALSRLRQVELTGLDDQGTLPSVTLTYGGVSQPQVVSLAGADGWTLNQRGVMAFDVDGDGMSDLLRLEAGNHQYLQGRGNYFGAPRPLTGASDVDLQGGALLDLDGDARPELVRIVDDTWRVYRLSGSTWVSLGQWPGTQGIALQAPDAVLIDLNGDGRVDVVRPRGSGITVNFGGPAGLKPGVALPALSAADVAVQPGAPDVRFVDMNGDGLADVVWLTDAWMKIFLGRGDGTFVPYSGTPYPWGTAALNQSQVLLGDLNRDGLVDLIRVDAANVTLVPRRERSAVHDVLSTCGAPRGGRQRRGRDDRRSERKWITRRGLVVAAGSMGARHRGRHVGWNADAHRERARHEHGIHLRRLRRPGGGGGSQRGALGGAAPGLGAGTNLGRDRPRRRRFASHRPAHRPRWFLGRRGAPLRWFPDRSDDDRRHGAVRYAGRGDALSGRASTRSGSCAASLGTSRTPTAMERSSLSFDPPGTCFPSPVCRSRRCWRRRRC